MQAQSQAAAPSSAPPRGDYVGTEACAGCHQDIVASYRTTNHDRTSSLPSESSILGSFAAGSNTLSTLDPSLTFHMAAKDGVFSEAALLGQPPHVKQRRENIDIVIGAGEKGQTYLYWTGNRLFQLPVSYWRDLGWINSPGYLDGTANFDRTIPPRCLECHATYFDALSKSLFGNEYDKTNFVLNLSCERCHGPGRAHVESHQAAHNSSTQPTTTLHAAPIINPAKLAREAQMDVCAQCHGGLGQPLVPSFTFVPGQPLAKYIQLQAPGPDSIVDVHGNQIALLERSRCYQSSANFTCGACHNPHEPEKAAAGYSTKCLTCHQPQQCGEFAKLGPKIADNCIDCHMPVQSSNLIVSELDGKQVKARVRNHWIKVYSTTP